MFGERLGQRIKQRREAAALTQAELAVLAGLYQSQISAYESGARIPELHNLRRLAAALQCTADDLLPPINAPNAEPEDPSPVPHCSLPTSGSASVLREGEA